MMTRTSDDIMQLDGIHNESKVLRIMNGKKITFLKEEMCAGRETVASLGCLSKDMDR